jgi:hypothetical protein
VYLRLPNDEANLFEVPQLLCKMLAVTTNKTVLVKGRFMLLDSKTNITLY